MSTAVPIVDNLKDALNARSGNACRRSLGCLQVADTSKIAAKKLDLPLASVDVKAVVADRLAHVTIDQTFQNPYSEHLEAIYIFPLAGGCVVSEFVLKVQGRVVDGVVMERQEARTQYAEAIEAGKQAAMVEQERDNVFTVQVGNLPPGENVTVTISYSEKLPYSDAGTTELRLPLVVAERYVGGELLDRESVGDGVASDTTAVADASRISPPRLAKGVNSGVVLSLSVTLEDATKFSDLTCSQHANQIGFGASECVIVSLARTDEKMDRDFVLRWSLAGDDVESSVLVYDKQFAMLSLLPPRADEFVRPARDVLFVIDRSGSMQGQKMFSAARACAYLLDTLGPEDRFAVQIFDDQVDWMAHNAGQYFYCADAEQLEKGHSYLRDITARGGTQIDLALTEGIKAFKKLAEQDLTADKDAGVLMRLPVLVLLTDGQVGNEPAVYRGIQESAGDIRIFTVGVDTAVNDAFLNRLANLGGGTAAFVAPGAQMQNALAVIGREIGAPVLTDLELSAEHCSISGTAPSTLPELFEGRATSVFFNLVGVEDMQKARVKVTAKYADGADFACDMPLKATAVKALPQLWAKARVVDLEDEFRVASNADRQKLKQSIIEIACKHSILTKFTAFVAVDAVVVNQDGASRKVVQPVAAPALWEEPESMPLPGSGAWGAPAAGAMTQSASAWGSSSPFNLPTGTARLRRQVDAAAPSAFVAGYPANGGLSGGSGGGGGVDEGTTTGSYDLFSLDSFSLDSFSAMPPPSALPPVPPKQAGAPAPRPVSPPASGSGFASLIGSLLPVLKRKDAQPLERSDKADGKTEDLKKLKECYDDFARALNTVLDLVIAGAVPSSEQISEVGKLRGLMLDLLNQSSLSACVDLQRYLKAEMPVLLGALTAASKATDLPRPKTQKLAECQKASFKAIDDKFVEQLCAESLSFWEVSV